MSNRIKWNRIFKRTSKACNGIILRKIINCFICFGLVLSLVLMHTHSLVNRVLFLYGPVYCLGKYGGQMNIFVHVLSYLYLKAHTSYFIHERKATIVLENGALYEDFADPSMLF